MLRLLLHHQGIDEIERRHATSPRFSLQWPALMRFLAPSFLNFLWLAVIPLVLWLYRRRAKRISVSTLLFFRTLAREHNESAWLRRIKKWLSLALTLLVMIFAVLALARPTREAASDTPGGVVVMIDVSASMAASDGKRSRLDEAKELARARVRSLPDNVVVSLLAFDERPSVLLSRSRNRRELLRLLDTLTVLPVQGDAAAGMVVARRLAALEQPSQIWHFGDERLPDATEAQGYRFADVALAKVMNVGITGFQLRKAPLARDRFEGFVRVTASSANAGSVAATLEARIGGRIAQLREMDLKPGESSSLILPLEGVHGETLELEVKCAGDALGWDNAVIATLPDLKPLLVAWVADKPDPFTELALSSLVEAGRLEIWKGEPKAWPLKDKPDVYVFENWVPKDWPEDRPAIALMPPETSGPLRVKPVAAVPFDEVRSVVAEHPVLYRVNTSRLSLTQTVSLDVGSALETLWIEGSEPVLAAGEFHGQRVVATAFSPSKSEQLALMPAYPLLLGNALYWCAENSEALSDLKPHRTGELIAAKGALEWQAWDGRSFVKLTDETTGALHELKHIGSWQTSDGKGGACVLASAQETDVKQRAPSGTDAASKSMSTGRGLARGMSWPQMLLWSVLALLLLESFLFHRKAVY
jgi:hypothetical protein